MSKFVKCIIYTIAFACYGFPVAIAQDEFEPESAPKLVPGAYAAGSSLKAFTDPSNLGAESNGVNLYTGQHQESFTLASIPGRGGLGVSLTLDYNGNVSHLLWEENRKAQASPFGFGFSLGLESIVCEHMGTVDIRDDDYKFISGGSAMKLVRIHPDSSRFVVESGDPWIIYPTTANIQGREYVIGWTVIKEDGSVYKFGDFDYGLAGWNATRNILRYGDFVGSGVTKGDTLFPFQWDLKRIEDTEGLNWLEFTYLHETEYLKVRNAAGDAIVNSDHAYTRASQLQSIETCDGSKIELTYTDRTDYQPFYGVNIYEFYSKLRWAALSVKNRYGETLSKIVPSMGYLNWATGGGDPTFTKLYLRHLEFLGRENESAVPKLVFYYHPTGEISRIVYPTGAEKEIKYSTTANVAGGPRLKVHYCDSGWYTFPDDDNACRYTRLQGNIYTHKSTDDMSLLAGVWDGSWTKTVLSDSWDPDWRDHDAISPDGWLVYSEDDDIVVVRWTGHVWSTDTLQNIIARVEGEHVYLYAGKNCFVAVTGTNDESGYDYNCYQLENAYFFRWDGQQWSKELVASNMDVNLGSVYAGVDMYAISYWFRYDDDQSRVGYFFGKYDRDKDTLVKKYVAPIVWYDVNQGDIMVAGTDFVAGLHRKQLLLEMEGGINLFKWNGEDGGWDSTGYFGSGSFVKVGDIAALPNGVAFSYCENFDSYCRLAGAFLAPDGWEFVDEYVNDTYKADPDYFICSMWGSSNTLVGARCRTEANDFTDLWTWNGKRFAWDHQVQETFYAPRNVWLFDDSYVLNGPVARILPLNSPSEILADRYLGGDVWSTPIYKTPLSLYNSNFTASDEFFVFPDNTSAELAWYWPQTNVWEVEPFLLFSLPPNDEEGDINLYWVNSRKTHTGGQGSRTFAYDFIIAWLYDEEDYDGNDGTDFQAFSSVSKAQVSLHQKTPSLRWGWPGEELPVHRIVDTLVVYPNGGSTAIYQTFQYSLWKSNADVTTPRFGRTVVSTPTARGNEPDGYTAHFFYNDANITSCEQDPRQCVDLVNAAIYGVTNGGYRLDGREYYCYSYNADDSSETKNDFTRVFHSLSQIPEGIPEIYRTRVDSCLTRKDSLETMVMYSYDSTTNQVISTRTRLKTDSEYLVDSVTYAYKSNSSMANTNALVQVSEQVKFYHPPAGQDSILAYSRSEYALKGSWKPVRTSTYRNFNPPSDQIILSDTLPDDKSFDQYGNQVAGINAGRDTTCVKFDVYGTNVVATATNCHPEDFLVQDFENGQSWDSWAFPAVPTLRYFTTTDVFTGNYGYRIDDDPTTTEKNWGPARNISVANLTDSMYYVSCWVKTNHEVLLLCHRNNGYDYVWFNNLVADEWQKIETVFHLSEADLTGIDHITVQMVLADNGGAAPGDYAVFDDFRFHPLDASVSAKVYDSATGLVLAESGPDNVPTKYEYDNLMRPKRTFNFHNQLLTETEYGREFWPGYGFTASHPYYVKSTAFLSDGNTTSSVTFYDGLGRSIQTRSDSYHPSKVVVGATTYDERGRVLRDYKPFPDDFTMTIDTVTVVDTSIALVNYCFDFRSNSKTCLEGVPVSDTIMYYIGPEQTCPEGMLALSGLTSGETGQFRYYLQLDTYRGSDEDYILILKNYTDTVAFLSADTGIVASPDVLFEAVLLCEISYYWLPSYGQAYFLVQEGDVITLILNNTSIIPTACFNCDEMVSQCASEIYLYRMTQFDSTVTIDTTTSGWLTDYDLTGVDSKAKAFWTNCGGYPYSENRYTEEVNSRLEVSGGPGLDWHIDSDHAVYAHSKTDTLTEEYVNWTVDQDNLISGAITDRWGRYVRNFSLFDKGLGLDSLITISYKDKLGRDTAVYLDTSSVAGADPIRLRAIAYNELGQVTNTWKVDYGTIRMLYDKSGNLRFMQNDKRLAEKKFVYYKYDSQGRKIEEGLLDDPSGGYFAESYAEDVKFPDTILHSPDVRYRWYYDLYDNGQDVILAPGALVRVEDAKDEPYQHYKEFYYYPEQNYDFTVVILPGDNLSLKAIRHDYNYNGSLKKLTVYPHWPDDSDRREVIYDYDELGRLKSLVKGNTDPLGEDSLNYAVYQYSFADGSLSNVMYGDCHTAGGTFESAANWLFYAYDPRGMLTGKFNMPGPDSSLYGGFPTWHFGLQLDYTNGGNGYYNGRVKRLYCGNSGADSVIENNYDYTFNDLGWLTEAEHLSDPNLSRSYGYNLLGNRTALTTDSDTIAYLYDSAQPGSSKLLWFTGMGNHAMRYDILGNMIADSSRSLYLLEYDYRNLVDYVKMSSGAGIGANDKLYMVYDHTGQRVEKCYRRYYLVNCDNTGPGGGSANPKMESMPGRGPEEAYRLAEQAGAEPEVSAPATQCLVYEDIETFYLYDNGVLLATFDRNDNVIEMMVNGPEGVIASYHENDDAQLYYYITDQIGSPRVIMAAAVGAEPQVTRYINYHPFGQVHQSWGSFDTPFKFTGKELDEERDFEFHYFGARYYDARIGMFSSIDKASQCAGGFYYGGNNPILMVDPDGNSFFDWLGNALVSWLIQSGANYVNTGMETGNWGGSALEWSFTSSAYLSVSVGLAEIGLESELVAGEAIEAIKGDLGNIQSGWEARVPSIVRFCQDPVGTLAEGYDNIKRQRPSELLIGTARGISETVKYAISGRNEFAYTVGYHLPEIGFGLASLESASLAKFGGATRFGPMRPGPLDARVANSFRSSSYRMVTATRPTVMYRTTSEFGNPAGSFMTPLRPKGPLQAKLDLALAPSFGNTATRCYTIVLPKGTVYFEGFAAEQGLLLGGGPQVWVPYVNPAWILK